MSLHEPLNKGEIRIFEISREVKDQNDVIEIVTKKVNLQDIGDYCALSYTWGITQTDNSHLSHTIYDHGTPIKVTENLHQALSRIRSLWQIWYDESGLPTAVYKRFRDEHSPWSSIRDGLSAHSRARPLSSLRPGMWADAICINQSDDRERSEQVRLMAEIFARSTHPMIWLGESFSKHCTSSDDLEHVLKSPWFSRRWVVQEASAVSMDSAIIMNDGVLPRHELWAMLCKHNMVEDASPLDIHPHLQQVSTEDLLGVLNKYHDKICSDPRDRVFSLLSISSDGGELEVDYEKSIFEVYAAVAEHYIKKGEISRVLYHALLWRSEQASGDWPSWLPNWSTKRALAPGARPILGQDRDGVVFNIQRKAMLKHMLADDHSPEPASGREDLSRARLTPQIQQRGLNLEAFLIHKCQSLSNEHCYERSTSPDLCIFCGCQTELPAGKEGRVCLLTGSPCAFVVVETNAKSIAATRQFRLQKCTNYIVVWHQGLPYRLHTSPGARARPRHLSGHFERIMLV